jgi:triosephosphate isomerase
MHKTVTDAIAFVDDYNPLVRELSGVEIVICPPFLALDAMRVVLDGTEVQLGAQNMYWEVEGAYTGEISPVMLQGLCRFVIIGHSERRAYFGESDETVNKKLAACFMHELEPILCVGESLEQREAGETQSFVSGQIKAALQGFNEGQLRNLVIAYEPIWAIGTGKAATPEDAAEVVNQTIRKTLAALYGPEIAEQVRILYGGSVKPDNAASFFTVDGIDGALVGGASLEAGSFASIAKAAV